ncbi:MAG: hypothetical protein J5533_00950 [Bacteroidales bacterium]|nr:hypothetical protein [Bacteroidales bacterium]
MKRTTILIFSLVLLLSGCNKSNYQPIIKDERNIATVEDAFTAFAQILSKAAYNEPALRKYIKEEALKQFDNDNDVFYQLVKDEPVDADRSFSDILRAYDDCNTLSLIEQELPLLTILVPDWSWVSEDCFSLNSWDTSSSDIMVSFDLQNGDHRIFIAGQDCDTLPYGCFTDTPTLIIKNNERIVADIAVRGSESCFRFIDPAFDNTLSTKDHEETVIHVLNSATGPSAWVSKTYLTQKVRDCYQQINSVPGAAHRDYVYYGMTSTISSGYIDNTLKEAVFRYNIKPAWDCYYESEDISFNQLTGTAERSDDDLRAFNWYDGHLEVCFVVNAGFENPLYCYDECTPSEAFLVTKVKETRHYNWLGILTNRVYFITTDCLVPKWVYPSLKLFTWDIASIPAQYTVQVYEHDSGTTITNSTSQSWQFMTNLTTNTEVGGQYYGLTLKTSYGVSTSASYNVNVTTSKSYTDNDDNLGSFVVQYINPIVTENATSGVKLHSYNTGKIEVCMVPVNI